LCVATVASDTPHLGEAIFNRLTASGQDRARGAKQPHPYRGVDLLGESVLDVGESQSRFPGPQSALAEGCDQFGYGNVQAEPARQGDAGTGRLGGGPWIDDRFELRTVVACPKDRIPDTVRFGEVGTGPQRAEPLDGLSKVQKSRASCHERVGHDCTEISMLGGLEDPVGDLDRSTVVFVHEVGTGELAEQHDACRIRHEIGELGRGGFEEGERVRGPVPVQEDPAKGCDSAGDGGAVIERALRGNRPPEMRLGGVVLAGPQGSAPGPFEEVGGLGRVAGDGHRLVQEHQGLTV
jgi:hypothetical protein